MSKKVYLTPEDMDAIYDARHKLAFVQYATSQCDLLRNDSADYGLYLILNDVLTVLEHLDELTNEDPEHESADGKD